MSKSLKSPANFKLSVDRTMERYMHLREHGREMSLGEVVVSAAITVRRATNGESSRISVHGP